MKLHVLSSTPHLQHPTPKMAEEFFEDFTEEYRLESGLSREEIERLTVDENLSELDRVILFLSPTAHVLQQSCALERLPAIFHDYGLAAYNALIPALSFSIHQFSPSVQAAAGKAFHTIMEDESLPADLASFLLPLAIRMLDSNQSNVLYAWLQTICAMAPKLPMKVVANDLMLLALERGRVEATSDSRVVCAYLLGAIAPLLEAPRIEKSFLHKAMALCQDTHAEVRISMCEQLDGISRAVGLDTTKKIVLPELCELLKDEDVIVHQAALKTLVQILDFLPSDVKRLKIFPILRSFCNQTNSRLAAALARYTGELMSKMAADLSEEDTRILIDAYKSLARHQNEEVRQACAQSFPTLLKSVTARKYGMGLDAAYLQLVRDSSPSIRSIIAASFHEVSKIMGKERTAAYLKEPFFMLLQDSSRLVQTSLITTLQHVIGQFSVTNDHQKLAIYTSITPYLLQIEKSVSNTNHWRLQLSLLETYSQLPDYLTSDQIYEHFVPICFRYMADGVLPVRKGAANTLAKFIRNNCRALQRHELSLRVVKEFGLGRSYWSRLVYIDFCESMLRVSSTHMFKEYFLEAAILSLQDGVASVRMRACLLLPLLKAVIKLPDDLASLERINFFATQRLNDSNKEVAAAARSVSDLFKNASVRCIGFEPGTETYTNQAEFEAMDKQREDEELHMLSKHEQDEKKKLDETLQKLKLDPSKKNAATAASASCITESDSFSKRTGKVGGNIEKSLNVHSRSLPRVKSASGITTSAISSATTTSGAVSASPNNAKSSHQTNQTSGIMNTQLMKAFSSTKSAFSTVVRPSSSHASYGSSSALRSSSMHSDCSELPTLSLSSSVSKAPPCHKGSPRCTKKTS